jgi:hypothetical protein
MSTAGYSGTTLPKKLGIKEDAVVAFANPPAGWRHTLGPLPESVTVKARARGPLDVVVLFVTRLSDLKRRFVPLAKSLDPAGGLWVAWPKQSSGVATDLSFLTVQEVGLEAGLVDNKVAALDETWSSVRFVYRRADRPRRRRR